MGDCLWDSYILFYCPFFFSTILISVKLSSFLLYLIQLKSWETTCYATADVRGVPLDHRNLSMSSIPHYDITRLNDLLSQPIDGLSGLQKERVHAIIGQFDDTFSLNTRSIEQSLRNIVTAQAKLADQFRPFLHALSSSPSQIDDTLSQNTRSLEQSLANILRAQSKLADQFRPFLYTLGSSQSRENINPPDTYRTIHTHIAHHTHDSVKGTTPSFPCKFLLSLILTFSCPASYCYVSNIVTNVFLFLLRSGDFFSCQLCFCCYFTSQTAWWASIRSQHSRSSLLPLFNVLK